MKRLASRLLLALVFVAACMFCATGCIDPDEALPHYYHETYP